MSMPDLPHGVAIAWGLAELPQRGPKRELSTERIVEAAIELADADGIEAVSMSRVATAVGFTPMSLYRYVTGKDDLLLLMVDAASDIAVPPIEGSWREQLRSWASYVRAGYEAHPWLTSLPPSATPTTPNRLGILDAALRAMQDLDAPDSVKVAIARLLLGYIGLFGESGHESAPPEAVREALPDLVTTERFPHLAGPVADGVLDGPVAGTDQAFHFGLARLLDGVQVWIDRADRRDEAPHVPPAALGDRKVKDALRAVREAESRLEAARAEAVKAGARVLERELAAEERAKEKQERADARAEAKAAKRRS